jgi:hypothetical protein
MHDPIERLSELSECVSALANRLTEIVTLSQQKVEGDSVTAQASLRLSVLGLAFILLGFFKQLNQFFRLWTALVVLGAYGYFWLNTPEYLSWWKRTVNPPIEKRCDMLSYPWGDRIESTVGNFGIWVQSLSPS